MAKLNVHHSGQAVEPPNMFNVDGTSKSRNEGPSDFLVDGPPKYRFERVHHTRNHIPPLSPYPFHPRPESVAKPLVAARWGAAKEGCEGCSVACLDEDGTWTGELTDQSFSGYDAADNTATCDAFHDIVAVPGYQMAVIDDVFLAFLELQKMH